MNLNKALERALHIEAVTKIEGEDDEQRVFAIQSKESSHLVNLIKDLGQRISARNGTKFKRNRI